jgi:hypothetical protein
MSGSGKSSPCGCERVYDLIIGCKYRIYKIPDGKPENTFAFSGEAKNKKYATEIIHECHEAWRRLISGESPARTPTYDLSMYVLSTFLFFLLSIVYCLSQRNYTD